MLGKGTAYSFCDCILNFLCYQLQLFDLVGVLELTAYIFISLPLGHNLCEQHKKLRMVFSHFDMYYLHNLNYCSS